MATYQIVMWRGVPASVEARDDAGTVTRPLSERFQMLIDAFAMQLGLNDSEGYLEQWSRGEAAERPGSAAEVAEVVAAELERRFGEFSRAVFEPP